MAYNEAYIITCSNAYNYGAVLQGYALQTYIKSKGVDARIINYFPPYLRKISNKYKKIPLLALVRKILYAPDYTKSKRVFQEFKHKYLKETVPMYSIKDMESLPKDALYIAGSDQIWNPNLPNGYDEAYYLEIPGRHKISYAASIGIEKIDEEFKKHLQDKLSRFDKISVREEKSQIMLDSLGIVASSVTDPVFLLSKSEWSNLCERRFKERYIVVYALHHVQKIYDYARELGRSLNAKVYVISVEIKEKRRGNDKFFWNPSVNDFLSLINDSIGVVTNSFHGASFATIFEKPLHIFDTESHDLRLSNLIAWFNLGNRIVEGNALLPNTPNEDTTARISSKVMESKKYLDACLSSEE